MVGIEASVKSKIAYPNKLLAGSADRFAPLLIIALGLIGILQSIPLGLGTLVQPGAGLWPTLSGVATIFGAVLLLFFNREAPESINRTQIMRTGLFLVISALFIPVYVLIGFIPSAFIVLSLLWRYVGRERWSTTVIVSGLGSIAIYAVFGIALSVPINAF